MKLAPNAVVELRYTGKKVPFKFTNEKMKCKSLYWEKRGDVVKCEYADALVLIIGSGDDFKIVNQEFAKESGRQDTQHRQPPEEKEEEETPYLSGDGVDGVDGQVPIEVPKLRKRRKDATQEA